jgi:hypothetical protein
MGSLSCRREYMFVCWEVGGRGEVSLESVQHFRVQNKEYRVYKPPCLEFLFTV